MAEPLPTLATLVTVRSATLATGTTTVTVLLPGVGSGVVDVPAAVFTALLKAAVTVALTTRVSVWPTARLVVPITLVPVPTSVVAPLLLLALMNDRLVPSTSVSVTFCATLGPRLTSVTV